jgi:serine/threonine protein kinase/tetratricopeptide (TPR) repeat protein
MTPAEFERLEHCFESALALSEAERSEYLDRELAGNPELRREAEALLSAAAGPGVLAPVVEGAFENLEKQHFSAEIGSQIGPWHIVREIGRGGMATVYLAVRTEAGFLHTVALKLIRPGMSSEHFVRRFRAERQILATLTHPHIAALIDGGATPDGRHWMVMEYIEGESAVAYVKRRKLPLRKRLELFCRICDAVEYAHQRQVIHRDIKPGNVLVTPDGAPKLLDFGIAKVLMPEIAPDAPETEFQFRLLTPDYASPEQIRGLPVSPATDVHALGVLLFEMLTERLPFTKSGPSVAAVQRAVCEQAAPRASRMAADRRLRTNLKGDLDSILSVALRKDPARRYASVAAFRDDIQSYLDGHPVSARRHTILYPASKWIRRHPLAGLGLFLLTCALAVSPFVMGASRRAQRTRSAEAMVERARNLLQHDPRTSAEISGIPSTYAETLRLLEEATNTAPRYAPAWLSLAEVAEMASAFDGREAPRLLDLADRASQVAVRLDPSNAHGWEMRAVILGHKKDEQGALKAFERAVQLNPGAPYAVRGYSNILQRRGHKQKAAAVVDRALELLPDPANPDRRAVSIRGRVVLLVHKAMLLHQDGRSREALPVIAEAIQADGSYRLGYWVAGLVEEALGNTAAAEQHFRTGMRMAPQDTRMVTGLAHVLARSGKHTEAQDVEQFLLNLHDSGRPVNCDLAVVRAGFGDTEGALRRIAELKTSSRSIATCLSDSRLDSVRRLAVAQGWTDPGLLP